MSRSNYAVSDFLVDRHPAKEEPFSGTVDPKENTTAYGHRAIPKLIELLRASDLSSKEKQDALKTVLNIDFAHQETKVNAIQQGLVESMKDCMKDENNVVRAQAIEVLGKLCTLKLAQEKMVSESVLPIILESLSDVANVCLAACNTLQKFSSTQSGCSMLVKLKSISCLVPLISNTPLDAILVPCLEIYASLTQISDESIVEALACDSIPALLKVIKQRPDLVVKCCCNLAKHMKGKEALVAAATVSTFAELLHHSQHVVQQRALCVIMLICVLAEAKKQACEVPMLVDHLVYILVVGEEVNEMDFQYAKATLVLISEYPKGREEVNKCIGKYGGEKEPEIRKIIFAKNTT